jgi:hypothetical protein
MKMYYTDPLKAAWMCREFGVKFQTEHGELMEYHHPFGWNSETGFRGFTSTLILLLCFSRR